MYLSKLRLPLPSLAAVVLSSALTIQAQYIMYGHDILARTRLDPVKKPGEVADYVKIFAGSNAIDGTDGDCTTAPMAADMSSYSLPQLYYKWKNGTYSAIPGDGLVTYWFLDRGIDRAKGEHPVEMPPDFRMVAGDLNRDTFDKTIPSHNAVSFSCFGTTSSGSNLNNLPTDKECENIRPQVYFPSCWNQKDSYLPDNSHVTYPAGNYAAGKCPTGFAKIPALFVETFYTDLKRKLGPEYEWYPGSLVFASGDNFGYNLQAEFKNGFPAGLMTDIFNQCPTVKGDFRSCPALTKYIKPSGGGDTCSLKGKIVNEPVGLRVPLAKLPGNNPEYSSSKAANNPKKPDPAYVETSSLVPYDSVTGLRS